MARAREHGVADDLVAPHIPTAFHAMRAFIESYRHYKSST